MSSNANTADTGTPYLAGNRFVIELDGISVGSFRSMSGLSSKQDVIEYKLSGDTSVRRKPGRVTFGNIILEKGFTSDRTLADWRQAIVDGKDERKTGAIVFMNADGSEAVRYNFFRAWPVGWEGPSLNAGSGETAIEKLELAVEWIQVEAAAG